MRSNPPVRDQTQRRTAAPDAPLRRVMPVCLQSGVGVAEGTLRAWREEAWLRWTVQGTHCVEGASAQGLAERNTKPSLAAIAQEFGAGLQELLRETRRLPEPQEKRSVRPLSLSARGGPLRVSGDREVEGGGDVKRRPGNPFRAFGRKGAAGLVSRPSPTVGLPLRHPVRRNPRGIIRSRSRSI